jgi:hypothetical protein
VGEEDIFSFLKKKEKKFEFWGRAGREKTNFIKNTYDDDSQATEGEPGLILGYHDARVHPI